jgi:PTH1 family peptidyl-tRNA hydrolase
LLSKEFVAQIFLYSTKKHFQRASQTCSPFSYFFGVGFFFETAYIYRKFLCAFYQAKILQHKLGTNAKIMEWLIIGLGNPGEKYAETRHNIGWMVAEAFAKDANVQFERGKGEYWIARRAVGRAKAIIILPTTYMNLSGKAASEAAKRFRVPPERVVAVVDEYNFPVGRIHLKNSGSSGGHNGTASLIEELRSEKFFRLRCGIAKNFGPGELVEYVLSPFAPEEIPARDEMITKATRALELLLRLPSARALQEINADKG